MRLAIRVAACLALAACPSAGWAQYADLAPGMPFSRARRAALNEGYAPYTVPKRVLTRTACGGDVRICETYPETAACAGTGRGECEFLFAKGPTAVLVIHTVGEQVGTLTVLYVHTSTRAIVDKAY